MNPKQEDLKKPFGEHIEKLNYILESIDRKTKTFRIEELMEIPQSNVAANRPVSELENALIKLVEYAAYINNTLVF